MIKIQELDFAYKKNDPLFQRLDLTLQSGKIYGLLGKNGTGKSTLLKIITGLLYPSSGDVSINSKESQKRLPDVLSEIYFLPEEINEVDIKPHAYIKSNSPFYPLFDRNQYNKIIASFEVPIDRKLSKMSYGQKKKFFIAFGLATNAKYLLLDEPTNGLDIPSKSQFRKVIASEFKENQLLLISTHQMRDLGNLIESVIIIDDGRIIFSKDVFEVENKIMFDRSMSQKTDEGIIYSEMITGGYIHLLPNQSAEPSDVELEVLFNAIVSNPQSINKHFN